ncbi:hypothetical protein RRG08_056425 [Elysia crispata]|uniref:Uncharacterized protein n=1 Tax=Elysia crispata TaxID=231223 RepID=A0AAE1DN10_9GAST|nr:hypothetical protein RRG08_056425 [Elysia crispata]
MITAVGKFVPVSKMCFLHQVTLIVLTVIGFSLTINGAQTSCTTNGWFGPNCQYQCHCAGSAPCDKHDGSCSSGCHQDWFGPACQYAHLITVNISYWNESSNSTQCPESNTAEINRVTMDISCPTEYPVTSVTLSGRGVFFLCSLYISAEIACPSNRYGLRCERECNCVNQTSCFVHSGGCPSGCAPGYTGLDCSKGWQKNWRKGFQYTFCDDTDRQNNENTSLFGSVHGVNIADCHSFVLLVCICISVCPRGRYGHHCAETCSDHCAGADHTCNYVNGSCDQGCDVGYLPPLCNKRLKTSSLLVPLVAVVVAAAVIIGFLLWRLHMATRHQPQRSSPEDCSARVELVQVESPPLALEPETLPNQQYESVELSPLDCGPTDDDLDQYAIPLDMESTRCP